MKLSKINAKASILLSCVALSFTPCLGEEKKKPAWLGIVTSKVDPIISSQLDLPEGVGAAIKLVVPDSPAEKAGLRKHDIIFEINNTSVESPANLSDLIGSYSADENAELAVIQKGSKKTITVSFEERPNHLKNVEENDNQIFGNQIDFGDLGGINFDILPFGNDQNLQEQVQKMQEETGKMLHLLMLRNILCGIVLNQTLSQKVAYMLLELFIKMEILNHICIKLKIMVRHGLRLLMAYQIISLLEY